MRLQSFINEGYWMDYEKYLKQNKDMIIDSIKTDCSKWLNETKHAVYRGMHGESFFFEKKVRTDRQPRDLPEPLHKYVDKLFLYEFGWKPRSEALFVAKSISQASYYGSGITYIVFPIGNYKYVYSDYLADFFTVNKALGITSLMQFSNRIAEGDKELQQRLDKFITDKYTDKGLNTSKWDGIGEIMIKCDRYFALKTSDSALYSDILYELGVIV